MDKQKVEWVQDQIIKSLNSNIAVVVNKLPLQRPKYSIKVIVIKDEKQMGFIPIFSEGQGRIEIIPVSYTVDDLIKQAENYILQELQRVEDRYIEEKMWREQQSMNHGKQETKHTGKTARDKSKKKY